jgi:hypothetical protein
MTGSSPTPGPAPPGPSPTTSASWRPPSAATLGRVDAADVHFSDAETLAQRMAAPTWLARTRLEWAFMLLGRRQPGDAERARDLLGRALAAAAELGLGGIERRAAARRDDSP